MGAWATGHSQEASEGGVLAVSKPFVGAADLGSQCRGGLGQGGGTSWMATVAVLTSLPLKWKKQSSFC